MGEDVHLTAAKDRTGRFSGCYKCSLCEAEFRPNPKNIREIAIFFAAHIRCSHPTLKTPQGSFSPGSPGLDHDCRRNAGAGGGRDAQADETPVDVQAHDRRGMNHQSYLWQNGSPGGSVVFDFRMGRDRQGPAHFLVNFEGILQTDGYAAYDRDVGGAKMVHAACWSHYLERGFIWNSFPRVAPAGTEVVTDSR